MHRLAAADAEQDTQHLGMGDPLGERGVEAGTALLDPGEVKAGRVGDRLQVVGSGEVGVGAGNRRMLADGQVWDGLRQGVAEVGVLRVAAVARPEAGVDRELHQVGEPPDLLRAGRLTARQSAELIQIDRVRAVCCQVGVDEGEMGDLIFGVVVDVLVHVLVQHRERLGVGRVPASAGNFAVLDAAELVVLLPQIGFDDFCCRQESENGRVSLRETATRTYRWDISQQPSADGPCSDGERSAQKGTAADRIF